MSKRSHVAGLYPDDKFAGLLKQKAKWLSFVT